MARKKIIAGNWKMNMTPSEAVKLVETLKPLVQNDEVDVVFGVPAIDIVPVVEACKGTNIAVAAENMYFEEKVHTQVRSLRLCSWMQALNMLSSDIPKEEITSEKQTKTLTRKSLKLSNTVSHQSCAVENLLSRENRASQWTGFVSRLKLVFRT